MTTTETDPGTAPVADTEAPTDDSAGRDLVIVKAALPAILANDPDDILGNLAEKIAAHKPDISTQSGRDEIRSLAAEIARGKMDLIRLGKRLTEDWRKSTKSVNTECATLEERMDALKDRVRRPLTDYENAEKERVKKQEQAVAMIAGCPTNFPLGEPTADELTRTLEGLTAYAHEFAWDKDFVQRASDAVATSTDQLNALIAKAVRREEQEAELARLRAAEAERQRVAVHQDLIINFANAARLPDGASVSEIERRIEGVRLATPDRDWQEFRALAARAREDAVVALNTALAAAREREAAAQAERERLIAARAAEDARHAAEAAALRQRQEAERVAAEALAEQATAAREAEEAAKRAKADTARAEAARAMAEARAAQEAKAAAEAAERATQQALETERQGVAAAAAREAKAAADREANAAHRKAVNNAALADMVKHAGLSQGAAKATVEALAKGQIANCLIRY